MAKTVEITCDGCGNDLTHTTNSVDYRLALVVERLPCRSGGVTAMMIYPPLKHDHYFCGTGCLDHWRDREHCVSALWRERNDAWKQEHGTKDETGRVRSYPEMPPEMRKELAATFAATALERFPLSRPGRA